MPCDARSFCDLFKRKGPTQRLKTAKKSFLRPLWTPNPNFWYLIFGQFFSLQNMGMWGVQSDVMWCQVLMQPFQTQGTPSEARNGKKKLILGPFWTPKPVFWPFWVAEWVPWVCPVTPGPYAAFSNPGDRISGSEWPKSQFFGNFGPQIPIFGHFELLSGTLEFEKVESLKFENLQKWS